VAFDESVPDVAGAGFVAEGDAGVCAIAALGRTAAKNADASQKPVRDIGVSSIWDSGMPGGSVGKTLDHSTT
jgi:hypothetical protein